MTDIPRPAFIRQFTAEVSALVAEEHSGDPAGELTVWLQMALRREASVGEVYNVANLERRLALVKGAPEVVALLRRTFSTIWAQEKSHAAYLEAVLAAVVTPTRFLPWLTARMDAMMGTIEGHVLSSRTSTGVRQQVKASLMLAAGQLVQDVPPFMNTLSALPFRDFCLLNAELESTAVHGYQRILTLLDELELAGHPTLDTSLKADVTQFIRDEQFHNRTFMFMDEWFAPQLRRPAASWWATANQPLYATISFAEARQRLGQIRDEVYGTR